MYDIQNYVNVNINGTSILLDYLANNKNSIRKVLLFTKTIFKNTI